MKVFRLSFIVFTALLSSCAYQRIGDLTVVSNRNMDNHDDWVLLARNVEAKASMKNDDALEIAIDKLTTEYHGEYLQNAAIYVKGNGKKVKVIGDVWGPKKVKDTPTSQTKNTPTSVATGYNVGDLVKFKQRGALGKIVTGEIEKIEGNYVTIVYVNSWGNKTREVVLYTELNPEEISK